jgi:HEAT repeat protein
MGLSGRQRKQLQEALESAFPTKASLEQMLSYELDKNLEAIAGPGNLQEIIFKIIQTAEAQGWILNLIRAAQQSNRGNLKLKAIDFAKVIKPIVDTPAIAISFKQLNEKAQTEDICHFLQEIENKYNNLYFLHCHEQSIALKDQYIHIQVTRERKSTHVVETTLGYAESKIKLKRVYAFRNLEESQLNQMDWAEAKKHSRIVVLADPGMGKSTLLKTEASLTAQKERESLEKNLKTIEDINFPLLLKLPQLAEVTKEITAKVVEAIPKLIELKHDLIFPEIKSLLEEKLREGKCLLLLDGIDEVPKEHRDRLSEKLNDFLDNYPCNIICTSRIVGYSGAFIKNAKEVEILPFSQKQTEQYIRSWLKNVTQHLSNDTVSALDLIQELRNKPQIQGLAQNPLLLSLICCSYQKKGFTLPTRRCQVYEQAVRFMLCKLSSSRKPQSKGRITAKTRLLEELAYHFTYKGKEIFSLDDLYDQIEEHLHSDKVSTVLKDANTDELIEELSEQDGILQKLHEDEDQYLFLHRTFQEYFSACYLNRCSDSITLVKAHFWNYDWHEILSLMAGLMKNPVPLLEVIIREKDDIFGTLLLLVGRCIAECQESSHPLLSKIIDKIHEFWCRYPEIEFIQSVVVALGQMHSQMLEKLEKELTDENSYVRTSAAKVLSYIGNSQAVEALIAVLNDPDIFVRGWAVLAIGIIGNSQAVQPLIKVLKEDLHGSIRKEAAWALGVIGESRSLQALTEALNDSDSSVREQAAESLGMIANSQAVQVLTDALNHSDNFVMVQAARALGKLGDLQAIDLLIAALNHSNNYVKVRAEEALSEMGNVQQVMQQLIKTLNDFRSPIRYAVARVLGKIGNAQALEALIAALNNSNKWDRIRCSVILALGKIANPQAVKALTPFLHDSESDIRTDAAMVLGDTGASQAVEVLREAIQECYDFVKRWRLAEALAKISNSQAAQALIEALNQSQDFHMKWQPAVALGKIGTLQDLPVLIEACQHSHSFIRNQAIEALGKIDNLQAAQTLIEFLKNPDSDIRGQAAEALSKISNRYAVQAAEALISTLNDTDSFVRWKAAEALTKIGTSETLAKLIQLPEIDIYDSDIFPLARTLAVRYNKLAYCNQLY